MAKTDILTATETYGKAKTAFALALSDAATKREQAMYQLGADISSQTGKVLTPNEVSQRLAPDGQGLAGTTMTTGFGQGALPTVAQEGVATTSAAVTGLGERGVGSTSGLTQQARLVSGEQTALATQEAIQTAQAAVANAQADVTAAQGAERLAAAEYNTVAGRQMQNPSKKPATGKDLNIWNGKVHNASGKTIREATKKEIAAVKATAKKGKK